MSQVTKINGIPVVNTYVTGFTFNGINTFSIYDNDANVFSASVNTFSATTISATTFYGDGSNLTGIVAGSTPYTTGFTYNNANTLTLTDNTGGTLSASINVMTGLTVNGTIATNIVNATGGTSVFRSIEPLTDNTYVLGSTSKTWSNIHTREIRIYDNSGNDSIGITTPTLATSPDPAWNLVLPLLSGGTFSLFGTYSGAGNTSNTAWFNLSAGTNVTLTQSGNISGGTIAISSQDTYTTGGTYSNGTAVFTNNTGGTFSVTGFSTGSSVDTYVTGVTISNGVLTISQNQGQSALTASTNVTRALTFNSNVMALNTAVRTTLTPLVMAVTRFAGTGAIDDAGLSFSLPNDYVGSPQFNFVWRAATTSANNAKIFLDIYTGTTNNLGSLTTAVETLSIISTPTNANTFIISSAVTSSLSLSGGDSLHVRIYRDPADAGDTYTGDLDMINLNFKYNSIS